MNNFESGKQAEYLDHVLTIKQFFNRHRNGGYIFAVSYSYTLKKEINKEIIDYCKNLNLTVGETKIEFDINKNCLEQLREAKKQFQNGLILSNIDELMLLTHDEFAYQLNQMREALFSLHIPILIWLTPENHSTFTHKAIDLYTRRDLNTLFFPEIEVKAGSQLFERSEMQLGQEEDAETLRTRIYLLEKQLAAARNDDISLSRIAKEIAFPLIKAYRQLLLLGQAVELMNEFKEYFRNDDREVLIELGELYYQSGNLDIAVESFEKVLQYDLKNFGEVSKEVAFDNNELGLIYHDKGNFDKSIQYHEKALALRIKLFGEENISVAASYNNLGSVYKDKGELLKTFDYYEKALAILLKQTGESNSKVAATYNNLGTAWMMASNLDQAIHYFNKSIAIRVHLFGERNPGVAESYNNLGSAWLMKQDSIRALNYHKKALAINLSLFGESHPSLIFSYNNLGNDFYIIGDLQQAKSYFHKSYNIIKQTYGLKHPYIKDLKGKIETIEKQESSNTEAIVS